MRATRKLCLRRKTYLAALLAALTGALPTDVCGMQLKKSDFIYVGDKDVQEGKPTWLPCSQPLLGPFPLTCAAGALVRLKKVKKVILNYAGDKRVMFKKENLRGCLARCPFWGPSH